MIELQGISVFFGLLLISLIAGHVVHLKRIKIFTEGSVALLVGLLAGALLTIYFRFKQHRRIPEDFISVDTSIFFDILLPPIIFNAGYAVKKKLFFANFWTLNLFGIVGTFSSFVLISLGTLATLNYIGLGNEGAISNAMALGTIFSATDSVAVLGILNQDAMPVLYSLVFGEGVVNDATSIVLLRATQRITSAKLLNAPVILSILGQFIYLVILSSIVGVAVGLVSAFIVRRLFRAHSTDREVLLVGLMGFLAYIVGQFANLSGIFSVFFCGITMSHYTWHGISPKAKVVTIYMFRVISFAFEVMLFVYAGFDMVATQLWSTEMFSNASTVAGLASSLLLLVMLVRAVVIFPLVAIANLRRNKHSQITLRETVVIWWAGIMRGAISVALTYHHFYDQSLNSGPIIERQIVVAAAVIVVLVSTVCFGPLTTPLLNRVLPKPPIVPDVVPYLFPMNYNHELQGVTYNSTDTTHTLHEMHRTARPETREQVPRTWFHTKFRQFDKKFMQPIFGGSSIERTEHEGELRPSLPPEGVDQAPESVPLRPLVRNPSAFIKPLGEMDTSASQPLLAREDSEDDVPQTGAGAV